MDGHRHRPTGALHEAFFDPVTVGEAIGADASDGVLKPASFTDANSASATLQRIAWEAGTVKLKVSPHTGLAGHKLGLHRVGRDGVALAPSRRRNRRTPPTTR